MRRERLLRLIAEARGALLALADEAHCQGDLGLQRCAEDMRITLREEEQAKRYLEHCSR